MCSVVGYNGKALSRALVLKGLARLEYRGYDSAGFSCFEGVQLRYAKAVGDLSNLEKDLECTPIDGPLGIGHTRWSTHGAATSINAHPHFDCHKQSAFVHNGIIENHESLRQELCALGHAFHSETDTEVVAHLFEQELLTRGTLRDALLHLVTHLEGAYALLGITQAYPDTMVVARKQSPLCIGQGKHGFFVASDALAFSDTVDSVVYLPEACCALVGRTTVEVFDFSGKKIDPDFKKYYQAYDAHEKKGYAHYMEKEIFEQKNAITATASYLSAMHEAIWHQIGLDRQQIAAVQRIHLIGCGTSWHAARIGQHFFQEVVGIQTEVHVASEFCYAHHVFEDNELYIMLSQSGETADTLSALRRVAAHTCPTLAVTNVGTSTLARQASGTLLTQAGPEISVASTKAFTTQLTLLFWCAHRIAQEKGIKNIPVMADVHEQLIATADVLEQVINCYKHDILSQQARLYASYERAIFIGRHIFYPFAMEAALKLKEIAYVFAQSYPAGELKHGPLALVDEQTPVFVFSHYDTQLYQKIVGNAHEAKARGGKLVVFAFQGQDELCALADTAFVVPSGSSLLSPLAMTGIMQFFMYAIAKERGCPIDKPRNLAKSVTVE